MPWLLSISTNHRSLNVKDAGLDSDASRKRRVNDSHLTSRSGRLDISRLYGESAQGVSLLPEALRGASDCTPGGKGAGDPI